nr:mechanosensitive ion channel domain-containing protein [Haloglomus halophilum]
MFAPTPLQGSIVSTAINEFIADVAAALPSLLTGLVFLVIAAILIKVVMAVVNFSLQRSIPASQGVYRQFISTIVLVFLCFGVGLSFLSIVGLTAIAASLGTATGFLALGVSYALSGMLADAVAGVYLLRDPDFMPGDRIDIGGTVGEIKSIELRKTRFRVEGDTMVRGNAEIEKKWTKLDDDD